MFSKSLLKLFLGCALASQYFGFGTSARSPQVWRRHIYDSSYCPGVDLPLPPAHTSHDTMLPVYELSNANFTYGTLRVREPGIYKLSEDIVFNPNRENNWYPVCHGPGKQVDYCGENGPLNAYQLGFFAAIALEGEDQHVDLNGYSLKQHPEHALQQRFYAHIELADQPFIPNQGPATTGTFGEGISPCKRCSVSNGLLGLASHHGIHGNAATDVEVHNVDFEEYEVAAISLNGCKRVEISNCMAKGSRSQIPTRGTYSSSRFMQIIWGAVAAGMDQTSPAYIEIQAKSDALQARMDAVFDEIINGPTGQIEDAENKRQFALPVIDGKRLVDGNAYGMVFHGQGVLVGPFTQEFFGEFSDKISQDIRIIDTKIENTGGAIQEVVTLKHPDGGLNVDVAGSVVRMHEILSTDGTNTYVPDALHDMRFALAYWTSAEGGADPYLMNALATRRLGTFKIDINLANWARDGAPLPTAAGFHCNADTMNHKQKGVVGLFLQEVHRFQTERVVVTNTLNQGKEGTEEKCGQYWLNDGHYGYTGSQTRAVAIAGSRDLAFHDFRVSNTHSHFSSSYGFHAFNDVARLCLNHGVISNVTMIGDYQPAVNTPILDQYLVVDETVKDFSSTKMSFAPQELANTCN